MSRILLTGASGFLGGEFIRHCKGKHKILALYHSTPPEEPVEEQQQVDLANKEELRKLVKITRPNAIVHLAALSYPNQCEDDPELSYEVNVKGTSHIIEAAEYVRAPIVVASTDLVFDGVAAPYHTGATTNPINIYGKHKEQAEEIALQGYSLASVARLPLMYGLPHGERKSFITGMIDSLRAGEKLELFIDEYRSVAAGVDVAQGLLKVLFHHGKGKWHLGGPQSLTRYQIGEAIAEALGSDKSLLIPKKQKSMSFPAKRPADVSLFSEDSYKILSWHPQTLNDHMPRLLRPA